MKKIAVLVLTVVSIVSCTSVLAESKKVHHQEIINVGNEFSIKCAVPEGYNSEIVTAPEYIGTTAIISSADEQKPAAILTVAFDEMLSDIRTLDDLSEDGLEKIKSTFYTEDDVSISCITADNGNKILVVKENSSEANYMDFYMIHNGYAVEILITSIGNLSDEQIAKAVECVKEIEFEDAVN